jgi:hypothetical protein
MWLLYKFHTFGVYKLITMKKTSLKCKQVCESKINKKLNIFYKDIAILCINMI